jgi:hypothetical protein
LKAETAERRELAQAIRAAPRPGIELALPDLGAAIAGAVDQLVEAHAAEAEQPVPEQRISPRTGKPVRKYTRRTREAAP